MPDDTQSHFLAPQSQDGIRDVPDGFIKIVLAITDAREVVEFLRHHDWLKYDAASVDRVVNEINNTLGDL